jgi:predicted nucleic acid-binding protein
LRNAVSSLRRLDWLDVERLPVTDEAWQTAAILWARARRAGIPTASRQTLDADVILAAQALVLAAEAPGNTVIVATSNVGHLAQLCDAQAWETI